MNTVLLNNPCGNIGRVIKTYREKTGLKQATLAKKAGISTSMLSQIERSAVSPSIETLFVVCDALGLDIAHLFSIIRGSTSVRVFHKGERLKTDNSGVHYEQLALSGDAMHPIEMFLLKVEPKQTVGFSRSGHEGIEMGYVLSGSAMLVVDSTEHDIKKGDSVTFSSALPHSLKNGGTTIFKAVWNVLPPHKDYLDLQ